ncbi:DUF4234 domain-containing protein [Microbulbifer elongatus]|uniref:DUF4234 domain-containing protein n=1 Tax=Microbulbifer elongatus TaxID=86173 RepID=UPI001CFDE443|nr:DUF4234 domain-containing protein [Microbulbifer elongatus]
MESNPYEAPSSDLAVATNDQISSNFDRFSAWWVFLLTIFTFGIYPVYWVYTRAQTVNRIQDNQIAPAWIYLTVIFFALTIVVEFIAPEKVELAIIVNIAYFVALLTTLFKIKNRLQKMMSETTGSNYTLGPVLTFFFHSIYLQYKINEFIDNSKLASDSETATAG